MSQPDKSTWGYTKHKRLPALGIAVPIGLSMGALFGALWAYLRSDTDNIWLYVAVFSTTTGFVFAGLIWVSIVDRTTIAGAIAKPEASIENTWHSKATSVGFFTVMIASSWGIAISSLYKHHTATLYLAIIFSLGILALIACYAIQRMRALK
ncbi:hypothetical protein [Arcanobacterium pinnipediorum]|uniref:DUF2178 domain-containing protein n=1 Tax=Arcanobacterium pinnipediorum TaxID=1503041 RepID=A0ABY5AI61_9ACTO|nr:hypothetical protein [Arcanobacterium pinnipediorum]USR78893.1 hypothetical protein NG665_05750 [Arcanobacterium pinnipediorum]